MYPEAAVADDLRKNFFLGLWVPAFAGTTTVYVAPASDLPGRAEYARIRRGSRSLDGEVSFRSKR